MCCTGKHQGTITWGANKWTNDNSLKYVIIIFCNILFVLLIWEAKAQIFRTKQKTARKWQSRAWSIISCLPLSHTAVTTPAFPQKQAGNLSVCWFNTAWFFGGKPQTWLLWEAAICFHCVRQTQSLMAWEQTFQPEKGLQHLGCSLDLSLLHCLGCLLQTICQCFSAWKGLNIKSTSWGFATSFHLFFISSETEIGCLDLARPPSKAHGHTLQHRLPIYRGTHRFVVLDPFWRWAWIFHDRERMLQQHDANVDLHCAVKGQRRTDPRGPLRREGSQG